MSEQETSSGDDFSGLTSFFFYTFIVHPCTAWILRPGRFERKKSIMYAIAFLAALAAIKTGEFLRSNFLWRREKINQKKHSKLPTITATSTVHVESGDYLVLGHIQPL